MSIPRVEQRTCRSPAGPVAGSRQPLAPPAGDRARALVERVFSCPICTRLARDRALCDECAQDLWARREPTVRDLGAYQTQGLFAWRRDGWLALRWWAKNLKQKEHAVFWREPAVWTLDVFGRPDPGSVTLVPVPAAPGALNHARGFARALGCFAELKVEDVLGARPKLRHQRRLDRAERRRRRYDLIGEVPRGPVIIVDDVITSGATIEAAYRALGQPARCRAWCLMDRRPPGY